MTFDPNGTPPPQIEYQRGMHAAMLADHERRISRNHSNIALLNTDRIPTIEKRLVVAVGEDGGSGKVASVQRQADKNGNDIEELRKVVSRMRLAVATAAGIGSVLATLAVQLLLAGYLGR